MFPASSPSGSHIVAGSPETAARHALERTRNIGRDTAAIEAAGLRNDLDVVDQTPVERCGVKCDMIAQQGKAVRGVGIAPPDITENRTSDRDGPIYGMPFPLAKRSSVRRGQQRHGDVGLRDVISGGMAGFERADAR